MTQRAAAHDYTRSGIYHITLHVTEALGQPLGTVMGMDADSAAVSLTPVGERVAHELTTAITAHYEMITVDEHVVMPEHLHFILIVRAPIVSKSGRTAHLGQVIAGFKAGCNRVFWAATGQTAPATPAATKGALTAAAAETAAGAAAFSAPGGFAAKKARYNTGRPPLFAPGYCDVQPIEPGQLKTQRAYIQQATPEVPSSSRPASLPASRPSSTRRRIVVLPRLLSQTTDSRRCTTPQPTASTSVPQAVCCSSPPGSISTATRRKPSPFPSARQ